MNRESYDRFQGEEIETPRGRCFACNRRLGRHPHLVTCEDEQDVLVGRECFKLIAAAGARGYQQQVGPRLFLLEFDPKGKR